jgi:hypothetical protein
VEKRKRVLPRREEVEPPDGRRDGGGGATRLAESKSQILVKGRTSKRRGEFFEREKENRERQKNSQEEMSKTDWEKLTAHSRLHKETRRVGAMRERHENSRKKRIKGWGKTEKCPRLLVQRLAKKMKRSR